MSIAICALTYKRLDGLRRLVEGLQAQRFRGQPPDVRIVVVDNDPAASARELCSQLAEGHRWPIQYAVEKRAGIAFGRNAALDNVGGVEFVCFIDDDEVPDEHWLDELLRVRAEYGADVVGGPVVPHFPETTPAWIIRGGFFQRQRYHTGQRLPYAFTNNVLFRREIIDELNLRFNERWALMGCEDQAFFQAIGQAGYQIVWADDALVTEWIPAARANARMAHPAPLPGGQFNELHRTRPAIGMVGMPGASRAEAWRGWGSGLDAWHSVWPWGRIPRIRALQAFAYAAGLLTGLLGIPYEEYRRTAVQVADAQREPPG